MGRICCAADSGSAGQQYLEHLGLTDAIKMANSSYFGIEKVAKFFNIIKQYGGLRSALYQLYRTDDLKLGKFIGEDALGNKYYEDPKLMFGRNRWVIYHPSVGTDYDGSMVPADWYGWLHHKTDKPPTEVAAVAYPWVSEFQPNHSGTKDAYMPYTTTKPKIEAWVPSKK